MTDVLVVGAGSAGCALAGRLAAAGASVLLLEAGPASASPEVADATSFAATAPGHPRNWALPASLTPGVDALVPRGRGLGGSSAINGAAWTYATPADAAAWDWPYADLLRRYAAAEREPVYGAGGPIPVTIPAGDALHPAAQRFLAAAERLGFAAEPDKNAGGPPGAGAVPHCARDGKRVDAASAYVLDPLPPYAMRIMPPRLPAVRPDAAVVRVLLAGGRATGVELADGTRLGAGETVLAAGAVGTPRILLRSGIGPGGPLVDLPVGEGWSDHPAVYLPFRSDDPPARPDVPSAQVALDLDAGADPAGDVEVLLFARPFTPDGDLHLLCSLQQPDSRGVLDLDRISYGYLRTEHDRRRLRHAIRTAAELLRAGVGARTDPGGDVLGNDRALDGWIRAHLTTAVHLCGSAALGRVVDRAFRVLGVDGLRVADTSVLPTVPRRGPAATAVAIGEAAAAMIAEPHGR